MLLLTKFINEEVIGWLGGCLLEFVVSTAESISIKFGIHIEQSLEEYRLLTFVFCYFHDGTAGEN